MRDLALLPRLVPTVPVMRRVADVADDHAVRISAFDQFQAVRAAVLLFARDLELGTVVQRHGRMPAQQPQPAAPGRFDGTGLQFGRGTRGARQSTVERQQTCAQSACLA